MRASAQLARAGAFVFFAVQGRLQLFLSLMVEFFVSTQGFGSQLPELVRAAREEGAVTTRNIENGGAVFHHGCNPFIARPTVSPARFGEDRGAGAAMTRVPAL